MKVNAWVVPGCDLSLLRTVDLLHIGLNGCINVTDDCIEMIATRCHKLSTIHLEGCNKVTDAGISALGAGCVEL